MNAAADFEFRTRWAIKDTANEKAASIEAAFLVNADCVQMRMMSASFLVASSSR